MSPSDLYLIAMESDTAYELMEQLCKMLGVAFPPEVTDTNLIFSTVTE